MKSSSSSSASFSDNDFSSIPSSRLLKLDKLRFSGFSESDAGTDSLLYSFLSDKFNSSVSSSSSSSGLFLNSSSDLRLNVSISALEAAEGSISRSMSKSGRSSSLLRGFFFSDSLPILFVIRKVFTPSLSVSYSILSMSLWAEVIPSSPACFFEEAFRMSVR